MTGSFSPALRGLAALPWPLKRRIALNPTWWRWYAGLARRAGWTPPAAGWVAASNGPYRGIHLRAWHPNHWWMVAGTYEPVITDWLARAVAWSRRTHGQAMVWDVGAHIGVTALCAAAQGASVLACEPAPDTMRELEEHCAANPALSGRVAVERVAVADHGGTLVMRTSAVSSISQIEHVGVAAYAEDGAPHDRIVVPTTTLDTLLERHAPPTVVKVDVEGAEGLVMRGARAVLAKHPAVWIVELHDAQVTTDVLAQFDAAGYVVRRPEARAFGVTRAANAAGRMDSGHLIAVPPGAPWP